MRIAVLTDIHANREAFSAVLSEIAARSVDRIAILGDIVGYGPDPDWCVERTMELVAAGALCVKGNHDAAAVGGAVSMNVVAEEAIRWTRRRLSDQHLRFLDGLPLTGLIDDVLLVHASANDPGDWIYVTGANRAMPSFRVTDARVILCGHVHVPMLVSCDRAGAVAGQRIRIGAPVPLLRSRRWLAVIGSVGQPRDGVPQAGYAVLDLATNELTFHRTAYDTATTARKIRAAGLPEALAARLMTGD
jgi:diadenosine tetraphosphatase ApaH/serine/threonine PP2A family protein phosphatase